MELVEDLTGLEAARTALVDDVLEVLSPVDEAEERLFLAGQRIQGGLGVGGDEEDRLRRLKPLLYPAPLLDTVDRRHQDPGRVEFEPGRLGLRIGELLGEIILGEGECGVVPQENVEELLLDLLANLLFDVLLRNQALFHEDLPDPLLRTLLHLQGS